MKDDLLERFGHRTVVCEYGDARYFDRNGVKREVFEWMAENCGAFTKDWQWAVGEGAILYAYCRDPDILMQLKLLW